jgi:transcription-repair coupling factor (superfamily II helicase)
MTKTKYPLTIAAAKKGESSLWEIGDALLIECPLDSERGKIAEVARELQQSGCEHASKRLYEYRKTAATFPPQFRLNGIAFFAHSRAGSPDMLSAIVSGTAKGTSITIDYIDSFMQRMRDHEQREREKAKAKAQAEREEAERKEEEARRKTREAKDKEEREARKKEQQQAEEQTQKAREKEQKTKTAPKKKPAAPKEEDVPKLVAEAQFIAHASRSVVLAREAAEDIKTCLEQLTAVGIAALTEQALEAANAWTEASQVVRSRVIDQRGHLSVVGD